MQHSEQDFGWGDAGWHRDTPSREVVTPTMDALVKEGVELNRHCENEFLMLPCFEIASQ